MGAWLNPLQDRALHHGRARYDRLRVGGVNFFHTERYFLTTELSKRLRARSRSRGVCFGVGRFIVRSPWSRQAPARAKRAMVLGSTE
jgi:hypothetical protein